MATVYRFQTYDIINDVMKTSQRWATREAVERVCGEIVGEGVEVDNSVLGREVDGMTERGFDPTPPNPHRFR